MTDTNTSNDNLVGFVYIARIQDHSKKFVEGYFKIGRSKKYKIRETQLNSTHLPLDVIVIRAFKTDKMKNLETLLHTCFDNVRVVKEYEDRNNITTEWFYIKDKYIEDFNEKIDTIINCIKVYSPETNEENLQENLIKSKDISEPDRKELLSSIERAKPSKVVFELDGNNLSKQKGIETYILAFEKISEKFSSDEIFKVIANNSDSINIITKNISDFDYNNNSGEKCQYRYTAIKDFYIGIEISNDSKVKIINWLIQGLKINNMKFYKV